MKGIAAMPKVTDQELAQIARRNIVSLCEGMKNARAQIAKECAVSPSMVTKWTTEANPYIPGALYLLTIADICRCAPDVLKIVRKQADSANNQPRHDNAPLHTQIGKIVGIQRRIR